MAQVSLFEIWVLPSTLLRTHSLIQVFLDRLAHPPYSSVAYAKNCVCASLRPFVWRGSLQPDSACKVPQLLQRNTSHGKHTRSRF
jgi:hypothetical protein